MSLSSGLSGPFVNTVAVTPSNSTVYNPPLRQLLVGTGGAVAIQLANDSGPTTWGNIPSGTLITNVSIIAVWSTNTTASNLVGMN